MPSEKSYARAHEIAAAHVPAEKANLAKLIRLRTDIALALDEAKAERTEECRQALFTQIVMAQRHASMDDINEILDSLTQETPNG